MIVELFDRLAARARARQRVDDELELEQRRAAMSMPFPWERRARPAPPPPAPAAQQLPPRRRPRFGAARTVEAMGSSLTATYSALLGRETAEPAPPATNAATGPSAGGLNLGARVRRALRLPPS